VSLSRAGAFVAIATATACAASTQPTTDPGSIARAASALGARTTGGACARSRDELVDLTLAEWRARPGSGAFDADWACVAITDDVARDSMAGCTPSPDDVLAAPVTFARRVTGELFYVGLDPREYAYDLVPDRAGIGVEVRVQLTGPLAADPARVAAMQAKMDRAADFWSSHSPNGAVRFRFRAETTDVASPHFQVRLYEGDGRTPFDVSWGEAWSWHLLAHEIGHMLGLDDEYGQFKKTWGHAIGEDAIWNRDVTDKVRWFGCNPKSLMCDSRGLDSTPQRYHYYVLLRRRACRVTPPDGDILTP
jgi:hypothetical protein